MIALGARQKKISGSWLDQAQHKLIAHSQAAAAEAQAASLEQRVRELEQAAQFSETTSHWERFAAGTPGRSQMQARQQGLEAQKRARRLTQEQLEKFKNEMAHFQREAAEAHEHQKRLQEEQLVILMAI